ncbi:lysosomal acid phosphatase-like [Nasonia vitripennis]|uniref:acid phosphatase n=1 Tax=Nasonia vitripennis TaxID=7425 RepID=A0A7M7T610_NASVI|nr:lysosomal acid phosphatase-like [Nasonia vitripennis]
MKRLFRHGDRTPEKVEIYKTDPYDPDFYEQYGYGQLHKAGMEREHKLGEMLRKRYNDFLGDYYVDDIYAYSTDYDRTKMSLQLVLNGLYPPTAKMRWSANIEWFPIPTHYEPFETDFISFDVNGKCSQEYKKLFTEAEKSPEVIKKFEENGDFLDYVRDKTQIISERLVPISMIASELQCVRSLGLPLPDWCSEKDFKRLQEFQALYYDLTAKTELMKRIAAGPVIERFLDNVKDSEKLGNKKKLYLYGAHDINVGVFTRAHNFTGIPKNPAYGSAVIVEKLRGPDDQIYLRMLYWTGVSEKLIALKLDSCAHECLLSNYIDIISPVLPEIGFTKCKTSACCKISRTYTKKINPDVKMPHLFAGEDQLSFKYGHELLL